MKINTHRRDDNSKPHRTSTTSCGYMGPTKSRPVPARPVLHPGYDLHNLCQSLQSHLVKQQSEEKKEALGLAKHFFCGGGSLPKYMNKKEKEKENEKYIKNIELTKQKKKKKEKEKKKINK